MRMKTQILTTLCALAFATSGYGADSHPITPDGGNWALVSGNYTAADLNADGLVNTYLYTTDGNEANFTIDADVTKLFFFRPNAISSITADFGSYGTSMYIRDLPNTASYKGSTIKIQGGTADAKFGFNTATPGTDAMEVNYQSVTVGNGLIFDAASFNGTVRAWSFKVEGAGSELKLNNVQTGNSVITATNGGYLSFSGKSTGVSKFDVNGGSTADLDLTKSSVASVAVSGTASSANIKLTADKVYAISAGDSATIHITQSGYLWGKDGSKFSATSGGEIIFDVTTQFSGSHEFSVSGTNSKIQTSYLNNNSTFKLSIGNDVLTSVVVANGKKFTAKVDGSNRNIINCAEFSFADFSGSEIVYIEDFADEKIRFTGVTELAKEGDVLTYFKTISADGQTIGDLGINNEGYFYAITSVPEPAEWAVIFGVIALGFVAYRRRK